MLALGYLLMGGSFLVLLGGGTIALFTLTMIAFTIGEMFAFSRQQAYAASLAPDDMRGRYSGFLSFAWSIGGIVTSVASLHLYETDPVLLWSVTAGLGVLAATLILKAGR